MKRLSNKEFFELHNGILDSFKVSQDRDCPDIRSRLISGIETDNYESVNELNLKNLNPGTEIYFIGYQTPAYYTLKIEDEGKVKMWRDTDANALCGPLDKIVTRGNVDEQKKVLIEEGKLRVGDVFIMPYFNYTDSELKEVLQPDDVYFATCAKIFFKKA
jgi:hypothetical protein